MHIPPQRIKSNLESSITDHQYDTQTWKQSNKLQDCPFTSHQWYCFFISWCSYEQFRNCNSPSANCRRGIAYYWVFTNPYKRINQGYIASVQGQTRQDITFRKELEAFRIAWENTNQIKSTSSEGFSIINEFRIPRRRKTYPTELLALYESAIKNPIQYSNILS
jgi:hypothetical protein